MNVDGIDASKWHRVKKWLKDYADGYVPESTPVFTSLHVNKFMNTADPVIYRRHLIALGCGLYGRLRAQDYPRHYHNKCATPNKEEKIDICTGYDICYVHSFRGYCL